MNEYPLRNPSCSRSWCESDAALILLAVMPSEEWLHTVRKFRKPVSVKITIKDRKARGAAEEFKRLEKVSFIHFIIVLILIHFYANRSVRMDFALLHVTSILLPGSSRAFVYCNKVLGGKSFIEVMFECGQRGRWSTQHCHCFHYYVTIL